MTFEEKYPTIEDIAVEVKENGYMVKETTHTLTQKNLRMEFGCGNPSCKNGRIYIEPIIRDMIRNQKTEHTSSELCGGREKGMNRDCMNHFEIKISITYKKSHAN